jgi:hypothetical protein
LKWLHGNEGPNGDQFVSRENLFAQYIQKIVQTLMSAIKLALCLKTT